MITDNVRAAVFDKLKSEWDPALGKLIFPNQSDPEAKPEDRVFRTHIVFPPGGAVVLSVGNPRLVRTTAVLELHGSMPRRMGTRPMNLAMAHFLNIFNGKTIPVTGQNPVKFEIGMQRSLGYKDNEFRELARIDFTQDSQVYT